MSSHSIIWVMYFTYVYNMLVLLVCGSTSASLKRACVSTCSFCYYITFFTHYRQMDNNVTVQGWTLSGFNIIGDKVPP